MPGDGAGGSVLDIVPQAEFAHDWVTCPTVVENDGRFQLWFSSYFDAKQGPGGIGRAESDDGRIWRRTEKPQLIVAPDSLDDGQVLAPEVLHVGSSYRMWYTGMSRARHSSGFGYYRIFLAESDDGLLWRRANGGRPVLDVGGAGSPDEVQAATPSIIRDGDGFRMWYAAYSPAWNHTICAARSTDGVVWRRENEGRPVRGLSPAKAFGHAVVRHGDEWLMLYMALEAEPGLYAAASRDGLEWTPLNAGKPVIVPGAAGEFDDARVGHPCLKCHGNRLYAWYTGYKRDAGGSLGMRLRIGLAEATLPPSFFLND